MTTRAGTAFFMAPEVLEQNYSNGWDMWSCGVILYIMLCGYPPFDGDTEHEILLSVQSGQYDFEDDVWDNVSDEAKDLIQKMLVPENERLSPKEALEHPWIKNMTKPENKHVSPLGTNLIKRLKKFQNVKIFKKAVLTFIASRVADSEIQKEMEAFKSLDRNKDGYITMLELKSAMSKYHSEDEVQEILKSIDTDKNGAINYTEFIAASLDNIIVMNASKIEKAFKLFDKDNDGWIDVWELEEVLTGEGTYHVLYLPHKFVELILLKITILIGVKVIDGTIFNEILKECDLNEDGKVDFTEFQKCMLGK